MICKIVGGGLILVSSTLFGIVIKLRHKKRICGLENFLTCIYTIEQEISENLSDMVCIFKKISSDALYPNKEIFNKFIDYSKCSDGTPLSELWTKSVYELGKLSCIYEKKDMDVILHVSKLLESSTTTTQIENLNILKNLLIKQIDFLKESYEKISLSSKLGFYFGIAIVVVLI